GPKDFLFLIVGSKQESAIHSCPPTHPVICPHDDQVHSVPHSRSVLGLVLDPCVPSCSGFVSAVELFYDQALAAGGKGFFHQSVNFSCIVNRLCRDEHHVVFCLRFVVQ